MQIISFLQQNAHPRVVQRIPSVPENVTDQVRICNNNVLNIRFAVSFKSTLTSACTQIRLWESDLNRVIMKPAHFIEDFSSRVCISYSFFLNEYIYIYSPTMIVDEFGRTYLMLHATLHENATVYYGKIPKKCFLW